MRRTLRSESLSKWLTSAVGTAVQPFVTSFPHVGATTSDDNARIMSRGRNGGCMNELGLLSAAKFTLWAVAVAVIAETRHERTSTMIVTL